MADITPTDIVNKEFRRGFRGYACEQVDDFLQLVSDSLFHALEANQRLRSQVESLTSEVQRYKQTEDLIKNSIVLAERTAEDLKSYALIEAESIRRNAEEQLREQRAELENLRQVRHRAIAEMRAALTVQLSLLDAQEQRSGMTTVAPREGEQR
jgi:cell division initiation protein